jgi:hypothetical protein
VKKWRLLAAYLAVFAMVCLVALYSRRKAPAGQRGDTSSVTGVAGSPPFPVLQAAARAVPVPGQRASLDRMRAARTAPLPATEVEPLFEADARVKIGEKAKLRFAARDRASGLPESLDHLSASVFHGNDPELKLRVEEVENGVYEVGFTPGGPGQFNVVLSENGTPLGSRKVGAVGVAGAPAGDDAGDPLSEDPRVHRARTVGRGRLR